MWSGLRGISVSGPYIALRQVPYELAVLTFPRILGPATAKALLFQRNKLTSGHGCQEIGPKTSMVKHSRVVSEHEH